MAKARHEVGIYTHKHPGPLLVITAGIHGNEPAGVKALLMLMEHLDENETPVHGTVAGFLGNTKALEKEVRFIDEDMNRLWKDETYEKIRDQAELNSEEQEMADLIAEIEALKPEDYEEKFHIDLHTTSSESIPYISVSERESCRFFANNFPMQDVMGFGNLIDGAIDKWLCQKGFASFTVEAGQHFRDSSIENCEAVLWMAMVEAGSVDMDQIQNFKGSRDVLAKYIFDKKKNFRLHHRQAIEENDVFIMEPGFVNFQPIKKGELLAHLNGKAIYSEWDGRILMPLYQAQGDDGFFVIEEI